jgi:hypothetical protein
MGFPQDSITAWRVAEIFRSVYDPFDGIEKRRIELFDRMFRYRTGHVSPDACLLCGREQNTINNEYRDD